VADRPGQEKKGPDVTSTSGAPGSGVFYERHSGYARVKECPMNTKRLVAFVVGHEKWGKTFTLRALCGRDHREQSLHSCGHLSRTAKESAGLVRALADFGMKSA
jgi:hypothetical protein